MLKSALHQTALAPLTALLGLFTSCGDATSPGNSGPSVSTAGGGSTNAAMGGQTFTTNSAGVAAVAGSPPAPAGTEGQPPSTGNPVAGASPIGGGGAASVIASGGSNPVSTGGTAGDGSAGRDGSGGTSGGTTLPPHPDIDADGCPLTQQGFSAVSGLGLDGTTGGEGGEVVVVTTHDDLVKYAGAEEPYIILVRGKITIIPMGQDPFDAGPDKEVVVNSNKTILGVGATAEISEGGFRMIDEQNVIIRNLKIGDTYKEGDHDGKEQDWDGVQIDSSHHIWIDHCDFHRGGDGLIDSRKNTTNLTVSWSLMRDHNKTFGIGWTDDLTAEITIHHVVIRNTERRNPSGDNILHAHLFNNWLDNTDDGNWARGRTNMVIENTLYENVNNPHTMDSGTLVAIGNEYASSSGTRAKTGDSYSVFNPSDFYQYDLHPTSELKELLTKCAGPRATIAPL